MIPGAIIGRDFNTLLQKWDEAQKAGVGFLQRPVKHQNRCRLQPAEESK